MAKRQPTTKPNRSTTFIRIARTVVDEAKRVQGVIHQRTGLDIPLSRLTTAATSIGLVAIEADGFAGPKAAA